MSYTHTLTETHQQKPRKPKLTFDNYKKNRLGDQTYENMTKQQKQQRRKKRFLENYKKNTKMNLKNSNVDEISTDSKEFSNRSQIFSNLLKFSQMCSALLKCVQRFTNLPKSFRMSLHVFR